MKKEKNRKRKEIRRRTHSLQYRVISFMCALLLICSTVLLDTGYISMASSFDDESIVEEVATDEFDPDVEVQDTEGSDVDFQQTDDVEGESIEEAGGMDAGALDFSSEADWSADTFAAGDAADNAEEKVTYTKMINNDSIEVKAEVPAGALPEGTELQVNPIEEGTEQYTDIAGRLNEQAQNSEEELAGFLAYDIYFTDAEGQKAEPTAKVQYSFQYTEATAPQLADPSTAVVKTVKIQKNAETNETELVQLNAESDQLAMEVNESRQLQKAGFQSANTAAFAFTWTTKKAQATEPVENQPEQPAEENTEEVIEQPTEETVQTPIGTIQITEDEVNVRTSPSTEAEILDVVFAGDQLPLLETITAEDGSIWFKVLYGESVGYVRNDVAEVVEEQQENTDSEENNNAENIVSDTQESNILTFTKTVNDDLVEVIATTEAGVIPADAELVVNPIEEGTSKYSETETRLNEEVQDGYEVAGFLAYDIYFQDSNGEKIEPVDGTVKVSISYLAAMAPATIQNSEVALLSQDSNTTENQDTSISVMHLVEDEDGNVQSVVDMTQEGTANVETNENGEVQQAEFETGSFSTFTITWTYNYSSTSINVKEVDTDGIELNGNGKNISLSRDESTEIEDCKSNISGYVYAGAKINGINGNSIKQIRGTFNSRYWQWSIQYSANGSTWQECNSNDTIYLIYQKVDVTLEDDLINTGNLNAKIVENSNLAQKITEAGNEVSYTWLKSTDGGKTFNKVDNQKHGDNWSISEDGRSLNVALDGGALNAKQTSVKYKARVTIKDAAGNTTEYDSDIYDVEYWNQLQNGSFESPLYSAGETVSTGWGMGKFTNESYKEKGGVWQSTGSGNENGEGIRNIEIVNTEAKSNSWSEAGYKSAYSWYGNDGAKDGVQFAELNCSAAGALYQDVITYSGESMNYWLSHRARGLNRNSTPERDTMYLVIMPTSTALTAANGEELKSQDQLTTYLTGLSNNITFNEQPSQETAGIVYNQNGILVARISSDDQDWHDYSEIGRYVSTSYMTRFFFVAAYAEGGVTQGNFLDRVGFSQELPPANPGTFNLQITKKLAGLTEEQIKAIEDKITFTIHAYDTNGNTAANAPLNNTTFKLGDMTKNSDGMYSMLYQNQQIDSGRSYVYEVVETDAELNGYVLSTTQTVIGGTVQDNKATVKEKDSVTFKFENTYADGLKYSKSVHLVNWDERTYDITLTASSKTGADITGATIKDYIDPNFELVDTKDAEVKNDANVQYVIWENQSISKDSGWTRVIRIRAKDSFIGGNNVVTNGTGSGITVDDRFYEFKQPTVNVKVNIIIQNKEVFIYKGDKIPTEKSILKQIFDTENIDTSYENGKVDVNKVHWQWYKDPACTQPVTDANGNQITDLNQLSDTDKYPISDTNYYIKVTYDAGAPSDESNANSTLNGKTNIACTEKLIGTYTVKVIKGQIEITKEVDVAPTTDKTFTFNVTKDGNLYGEPLTVTVKANTTVGEATAKLENLARGTYVVTETAADGYVIGETKTDGTNCKVSTNNDTHEITFKLGYKKDNTDNTDNTDVDVIKKETDTDGNINYTYKDADGGTLGKVEYTNQEIKTDLDLKKTDTNGNYLSNAKFNLEKKSDDGSWGSAGKSYNNFEVKNNDDTIELRDLRNGYYRLTEVEAPTGCSLLATEIYFMVENGTVTLTNEAGEEIDSQQTMWTLGDHVLTIKNAKIYSLPSSGGSGTYLYTISGVAFITAALLLFINNKRKEGKARA